MRTQVLNREHLDDQPGASGRSTGRTRMIDREPPDDQQRASAWPLPQMHTIRMLNREHLDDRPQIVFVVVAAVVAVVTANGTDVFKHDCYINAHIERTSIWKHNCLHNLVSIIAQSH